MLNILARNFQYRIKNVEGDMFGAGYSASHTTVALRCSKSRHMTPPYIHAESKKNNNLRQLDCISRPTGHFPQIDNKVPVVTSLPVGWFLCLLAILLEKVAAIAVELSEKIGSDSRRHTQLNVTGDIPSGNYSP